MSERVSARNVVHQERTGCATVVAPRNGLERFLAGRVPNLQLDVLCVDLDGASSELNADGEVVLLAEALVSELEQQAGLAHTYIRVLLNGRVYYQCRR